jgi:capsular exopolysaccharide synthesis family protein
MKHPRQLQDGSNGPISVQQRELQQPFHRLPYVDRLDYPPSEETDFSRLLEYRQILLRHKGTLFLLTLLGGLAAFLFSLYQTPVYRARASLEIQGLQETSLDTRGVNTVNSLTDIQTQINLLQSKSLLGRVMGKMTSPGKPNPNKVDILEAGESNAQGQPVSPRKAALAMAVGSLTVSSARDSRIVNIVCDSTDPQIAADVANTLAKEYIEQNVEERWNVFQHTGEWLARAQEELKSKLEQSEQKLHDYAREAGLLLTSEANNANNVAEEKLRQLQAELSSAQADRFKKQAQFGVIAGSPADSLPEVLDNGPLRQYQVQLSDLRRQLADLRSTLTPAHYKVKRLQAQIAEVESTLAKERSDTLNRIRNEYQAALQREKLIAADYASQSKLVSEQAGKLIQYNILKREVDTNRQLYDTTLQKGKEASVVSALRASNARVVDSASAPLFPYKPDQTMYSALGALSGLFLGVALVLFRESSKRSVDVPGEMPSHLSLRELGAIPSAKADPALRALAKGRSLFFPQGKTPGPTPGGNNGQTATENGDDGMGNGQQHECVELATWTRKPSLVAESFRATLTSILFSGQNGDCPQVIVVTSPKPQEGKSTIISNLGIALAELDRRVLLIDADMRRPRLHSIFNCRNTWGFSDLLRERTSIEECPNESLARKTEIPNLYLLPSGPGTVSVSNLLFSIRMPKLILRLRREFEMVLIDTPPMLQIPDARVLGRLADGVILVFRAGIITPEVAATASQCFEQDGTAVLGSILNDWDPTAKDNSYYNNYYSYYRNGGKEH